MSAPRPWRLRNAAFWGAAFSLYIDLAGDHGVLVKG
jgi:hypothetical protein